MLEYVFNHGTPISDKMRKGELKEIENLTIAITEPTKSTQLPKDYKLNENEAILDGLIHPINDPIYYASNRLWGQRVKLGEYDMTQIDLAAKTLSEDPTMNRVVALTLDREEDLPRIMTKEYEFPALIALDFKYRNQLNITAYMRSLEMYKWFPINAVQLCRLAKNFCDMLVEREMVLQVGRIVIMTSSAHVRSEDYHEIKSLISSWKSK